MIIVLNPPLLTETYMPLEERPSKKEKKDPSKDPKEDGEPKEEGVEKKNGSNGNGDGHDKGKSISKDFKDRWEKVEGKETPPEEPKPVGLGLFKQKMGERRGQTAKGGFLTPALADAAKRAMSEGKKKAGPEAPRPEVPPKIEKPTLKSLDKALEREAEKIEKGGDVLDRIIGDLKGHREEFIQRRKEELKKEAERPRADLEPHLSKLKVIKEEMEKKRRGEQRPDVLGVGFTAKDKEARIERVPHVETMKTALKASMDKTVRKGSIIKRLDEVLVQPMSAIEEESGEAKQRLLDEIALLDTRGFEGRVKKLLSKVRKGKVFQAERDLLNLKIAMEAQRSREQLKRDREERLEAHLSNIEGESEDLEDVVSRHVKALDLEMDQTRARVNRDLRKLDTTGFEHVVKRITDMLEEGRAFDAEEQLLELKLALKARELRDELRSVREERIIKKAQASMPMPPGPSVEARTPKEKDLLEEIAEQEALEGTPPIGTISEVQCGVCGTILQQGATTCPACGTSFVAAKAGPATTSEKVPEAELEELEEEPGEPLVPERPEKPGPLPPPRPPEEPELSEIQCGVCGSIVPTGAKRCRACGTLLTGPEFAEEGPLPELGEPERYPSLVPIDEEESYPLLAPYEEKEGVPELVPIEETEQVAELVPIEEEEGYPVLAPADEEEQLPEVVPGKGMKCPKCSEFSPIDSITCVKCGSSLGLPEFVPVGPEEEATEEISLEEEVLEAVEEEVVGELEVEAEAIEELEAEAAEGVEGVPWSELPKEAEKELEWRRLCVRAKRFYNDGRVKAALEAYDDAIEIKPSFDAYYGKGEALLSLGWTNSALDCINQALEVDEDRLSGWMLKAKAQEALGKYTDALESIDRAIAVDEESSEAWHLKGTLLMQMGRIEEAIKALDRYVGIKPTPEALREAVQISKKALAEAGRTAEVAEELEAVEAEELEGLRTRPEAVSSRQMRYRTLAKQRGLTNGFALVNGRGLTNGRSLINGRLSLINGRSKINGIKGVTNGTGKGLINGRGLVNGASGLVNGRAVSETREGVPAIRIRRSGRARALQVVGVMAVILLGILAPLAYFTMFPTPSGITIDGQFQDWGAATIYDNTAHNQQTNLDINIVQYGMYIDDKAVSFYVRAPVGHRMLNGANSGVDVVHVFFDTDGSEATGYSIGGIGADRMFEVYGWEGKVQSASLYSFDTASGRHSDDWNGWVLGPAISAMSKGDQLELQAARGDLGTIDPAKVLALVHISDMSGDQDFANNIIAKAKGALTVSYDYMNQPQVQPGTQTCPFIRFNMTAKKTNMEVQSISLARIGHFVDRQGIGNVRLWADKDGNGAFDQGSDLLLASGTFGGAGVGTDTVVLEPTGPLLVQPDTVSTFFVTVDILDTMTLHQTLGLDLARGDIKVKHGAVTLNKVRPSLSYIGSPTDYIIIDGQFDDWARVPSNIDHIGDSSPEFVPRIDLRDYRSHFDPQTVSFYIGTTGDIMSGMIVPDVDKVRPIVVPGNQTNVTPPVNPPPLPRVSGADVLAIYLDTDQDPATGFGLDGLKFGADYLVQIEGKAGLILSSKLYKYTALAQDPWQEVKTVVPAATDWAKLETQVQRSALGLDEYARIDAYFVMSDWKDNSDSSDTILLGNRGSLQARAVSIMPDTVVYGTADVALVGLELRASEDVVLRGLTYARSGNATDMDTGAVHIYLDNGDNIFNALDMVTALASGQFVQGVADLTLDPPFIVQGGVTVLLFVAGDFTIYGNHHTIGVTLEKNGIRSTAKDVIGTFPMATAQATIGSTGIRSNNYSINFLDGRIDNNWGRIGANNEGYVWDDWAIERRRLPNGSNIRDVEICDDGKWLNFHVRMRGNLASNVHVYIDTNVDGTADYDLIYDRANAVVKLYQYVNNAWNLVALVVKDRYDLVGVDLELGIEFNYLNLGQGQTIKYQVRTEEDTIPGGNYIDVAPGILNNPGWSGNYVTLPEFKDIIIPIIGTIVAFGLVRNRRAKARVAKGLRRKARRGRT